MNGSFDGGERVVRSGAVGRIGRNRPAVGQTAERIGRTGVEACSGGLSGRCDAGGVAAGGRTGIVADRTGCARCGNTLGGCHERLS